jgi:epoxyqueuosine reductase
MTLTDQIKAAGRDLGFSVIAITRAQPSPRIEAYLRWIEAGMHGTMGWMAREDRVIRRKDPTVILPGARSFIVAAMDYYAYALPSDIVNDPLRGRFSNYAWNLDYHDIMLPRLEELAGYIEAHFGGDIACRAYVDTGAVLERSHAAEAGIGFTGKNTMLIHPRRGSFFFLGEIITTADLESDEPTINQPDCGICTRCLTACPTAAFPRPYVLDARRCISYLTIEHSGFIPRDLRPLMGNWVYGCDVCQDVCPWQRFADPTPLPELFSAESLDRAAPPLDVLLSLDENDFATMFTGSPVERIGRGRLVRNSCIAAGNSGHIPLAEYLTPLLDDAEPAVRGHAAWALGALGNGAEAVHQALHNENDPLVSQEFDWVLETFHQ